MRATLAEAMVYPPYAGLPALRIAVASYLQLSHGIACSPAQVFITSGYRNTLELITRALLTEAGMRTVPVAVDADGLMVSQGIDAAPHARAAVVTPDSAKC